MTSNAARSYETEPAYLEGARILECRKAELTVEAGARTLHARRAAACLLEPRPGDHVLLATVGGAAYVVTVLEREAGEPARVAVDGDLQIRVRRRFQVTAQDGIDLTSGRDMALTAAELKLSAIEGNVFIRNLLMLGDRFEAQVTKLNLLAETVDTVAQRLRQKLQRCYRFVEGFEQLRAGTMDYKAKSFARVHAEDTLVTAERLVKLDGEQIHMG
jgi:hypothetical protein